MGAGRGRRTGMVLILIIVIILVVVGGIGYMLLQSGNSVANNPPSDGATGGEPTAIPEPVTVNVIVAARDLPRGTRLSRQDVTMVPWPLSVARPTGALEIPDSPDAAGLEQVDGRIAKVDILSGQPVLNQMITPGDQPAGLGQIGSDAALVIPSGQVAIAFPLNRLSGVAYAMRAGDHVDILVSFRMVDVDEDFQTILPNHVGAQSVTEGQSPTFTIFGRQEQGPLGTTVMVVPSEDTQRPRQVTQMLIDNVTVLRVGTFPLEDIDHPIVVTQAAPQPTESAAPAEGELTPTPVAQVIVVPDIVTLMMSRQDALVLKYALETGADIDFALRSVLDNEITDVTTDSVTLQYIIDFYNVAIPPRMPIAPEPRIDLMAQQTGIFTPVESVPTTPPPAETGGGS
jgi:Flp pilus assembly protein CpaB